MVDSTELRYMRGSTVALCLANALALAACDVSTEDGDLDAAQEIDAQTTDRGTQTTPAGVEGEGGAASWEGSSDTRLSEPDVPPGDVGQATDPIAGSAGETDAAGGNAEPESGPEVER